MAKLAAASLAIGLMLTICAIDLIHATGCLFSESTKDLCNKLDSYKATGMVENCDSENTKKITNGFWPIISEYSQHKELVEKAKTILVDHFIACGYWGQYNNKIADVKENAIFKEFVYRCNVQNYHSDFQEARAIECLDMFEERFRYKLVDFCTQSWSRLYGPLADILLVKRKNGTYDMSTIYVPFYCGVILGKDGDYVFEQLKQMRSRYIEFKKYFYRV